MRPERGIQVIYVPTHANGDVNHPDCERGFIMSSRGSTAFCRFWSKDLKRLRTVSCSESCNVSELVVADSVPQSQVNYALTEILADQESESTREMKRLVRQKLGDALDERARTAFFSGRDAKTKASLFGIRYGKKGGIE